MTYFYGLITLFFVLTSNAIASPDPIPASQAFQFSATAKDYQTVLLSWKIAPNYYLYQKHFAFRVLKPANVMLGGPLFPSDTQRLNTLLGTFLVYANSVTIPVPIINATEKSLILQ